MAIELGASAVRMFSTRQDTRPQCKLTHREQVMRFALHHGHGGGGATFRGFAAEIYGVIEAQINGCVRSRRRLGLAARRRPLAPANHSTKKRQSTASRLYQGFALLGRNQHGEIVGAAKQTVPAASFAPSCP
jgi:hypothetical protein